MSGKLTQGPAYATPVALQRAKLTLAGIGVIEMHEAFAAQVLSNIQWLGSKKFAQAKLGRSDTVGEIDPEKINRSGGSIAIGHPFGATGARILTTVCNELQRTGPAVRPADRLCSRRSGIGNRGGKRIRESE